MLTSEVLYNTVVCFCMYVCMCACSPWTDKYECAEENVFSEVVGEYISRQLDRLRSEAVVYTHEEYARGLGPHVQEQTDQTTPPQWTVVDVAPSRRGVVVRDSVPQDELVMEYKVWFRMLVEEEGVVLGGPT